MHDILPRNEATEIAAGRADRWVFVQEICVFLRYSAGRRQPKMSTVIDQQVAQHGFAKARRPLQHGIEYRREIAGRGIDDLQYLSGRGLLGPPRA